MEATIAHPHLHKENYVHLHFRPLQESKRGNIVTWKQRLLTPVCTSSWLACIPQSAATTLEGVPQQVGSENCMFRRAVIEECL